MVGLNKRSTLIQSVRVQCNVVIVTESTMFSETYPSSCCSVVPLPNQTKLQTNHQGGGVLFLGS